MLLTAILLETLLELSDLGALCWDVVSERSVIVQVMALLWKAFEPSTLSLLGLSLVLKSTLLLAFLKYDFRLSSFTFFAVDSDWLLVLLLDLLL